MHYNEKSSKCKEKTQTDQARYIIPSLSVTRVEILLERLLKTVLKVSVCKDWKMCIFE